MIPLRRVARVSCIQSNQRPAQCFAYVADAVNPKTWKLHLFYPNGAIDMARLPKAIQTIVTDYPGLKVKGIPFFRDPSSACRFASSE